MTDDLPIAPGVTLPGSSMEWTATRASGPGGQHVNKVATRVELRFDFQGCACLDDGTRARLRQMAAGRLDADGRVLLTSQATRSLVRNLDDVRARLAALVRAALTRPKRRRPTRPTAGSRRRRLEGKKRAGARKRDRSWRPE